MRWFKHLTRAHLDETVTPLLATLGPEGYGFYWLICEIVAESMDNSDRCSATHLLKVWSSRCHTKPEKMSRTARKLASLGLIEAEQWSNTAGALVEHWSSSGQALPEHCRSTGQTLPNLSPSEVEHWSSTGQAVLRISVPKLLKYRDEYSKKSGHRSGSGANHVRSDAGAKIQIEKQIQKTDTEGDVSPARDQVIQRFTAAKDPDWEKFRTAGEEYGWKFSEVEWGEAYEYGWEPLEFPQKLTAVTHLRALIVAGDPGLRRATAKNYLKNGMYERAIVPAQAHKNGTAPSGGIDDAIERAKELARERRANATR
jgi:hypothetical protein